MSNYSQIMREGNLRAGGYYFIKGIKRANVIWNLFNPHDKIMKNSGCVIHHKNEITTDDTIENLQKMTISEHISLHHKDKKVSDESKLKMRGENHSGAKLTEKEVLEIRRLYKSGDFTQQQLRDLYGMNVDAIVTGRTWSHVDNSNCITNFYKSKGVQNSNAKLTEKIVLLVREYKEMNSASFDELSQKININISTIRDIIYRRTWKHI